MRLFLTLCSLYAVALAKPQYNYGAGVSGTFGAPATGFGSGSGISTLKAPSVGGGSVGTSSSFGSRPAGASSFSSAPIGGGSFGSSSFGTRPTGGNSFGTSSTGGGSYGSNSIGSFGSGSFGSNANGGASSPGFEPTLVHKQFITVAAPEDRENLEQTKHLVIGRPQKNYRVVFIKAPSSSNANVKLSAEYAPKEEKTVIYVLSKNDNQLEVSDIATPAPTVPSKPEVFFIKYKTEEEAQHAQRQIQAEYDKIEGSSEHTDAGVAPQQSVIGVLGDGGNGVSTGVSSGSSGSFGTSGSTSSGNTGFGTTIGSTSGGTKSSAYLPPAGQ